MSILEKLTYWFKNSKRHHSPSDNAISCSPTPDSKSDRYLKSDVSYSINVFAANGGTIVEVNRRCDQNSNSNAVHKVYHHREYECTIYIVNEDENMGERLAQILLIENLKA